MIKETKKIVLFGLLTLCALSTRAQETINPIVTAVPSLSIAPDARGGGMGDVGAATLPDVYSQYWNPAKYSFMESKAGIGISYTPWLSKIVKDIALINATGYFKFGEDNNQALSASIRYFSIGDINETTLDGTFVSKISPYEMAFDVGYSRKLTQTFSGAVVLRYIRTDYSTTSTNSESSPGNAFAADIAGYNESYITIGSAESLLGLGFNISNIGSKISMDGGNTSYFLPTNLRLGGSLTYPLDEYNTLAFSLDLNKLLVPSRPIKRDGETNQQFQERLNDVNRMSSIKGIFNSFSDSPYGFKGELEEITWSTGLEYAYDNKFKLRGGYFNESKKQGNRKYFSFGAGFKMNVFSLDAAYLISTADSNPLDQTLRFSVAFDMAGLQSLFK